jgi:DNA invertase Pin-like site-specific DNA recombinase
LGASFSPLSIALKKHPDPIGNFSARSAQPMLAGCERTFTDRTSGAPADRPGLRDALAFAREGDVLAVWKCDRLSRSLAHLIETVQELERRRIGFRLLAEGIDTGSAGGKIVFPIFAALASVERSLIQERTRAGLAAARQRGRVGGRPKLLTNERMEAAMKLLGSGTAPREVANILGVSIPKLYRHCPGAHSGDRDQPFRPKVITDSGDRDHATTPPIMSA